MSLTRYDILQKDALPSYSAANLLYISNAKYGKDWLSIPHTHECTEIFYIFSGQGAFLIGAERFPVTKGDLIVVNPLTEHTEASSPDQPLEYIVLGVSGLEFSVKEESPCPVYIVRLPQSHIQHYFLDMLREAASRGENHEAICQALLDVLVLRLMRRFQDLSPSATTHRNRDSATVHRYIDVHFKEPITLDLLANIVHINKYHMVHNFTRDYGISPIQYLLQLRLQESCALLKSTNLTVAQISQAVGFSSPCYFTQVFRKAMNTTPSQYRLSFRQKNN